MAQHTSSNPCPPWCRADHFRQDPDELVHRSTVEHAGEAEVFLQLHAGRTALVLQIDSAHTELDDAAVSALRSALAWNHALWSLDAGLRGDHVDASGGSG